MTNKYTTWANAVTNTVHITNKQKVEHVYTRIAKLERDIEKLTQQKSQIEQQIRQLGIALNHEGQQLIQHLRNRSKTTPTRRTWTSARRSESKRRKHRGAKTTKNLAELNKLPTAAPIRRTVSNARRSGRSESKRRKLLENKELPNIPTRTPDFTSSPRTPPDSPPDSQPDSTSSQMIPSERHLIQHPPQNDYIQTQYDYIHTVRPPDALSTQHKANTIKGLSTRPTLQPDFISSQSSQNDSLSTPPDSTSPKMITSRTRH
jgi:chaperonin cofactor prefoldin